jgi:hypothetical protein
MKLLKILLEQEDKILSAPTIGGYLSESDLLYRSGDLIKKSEDGFNMTSNRNTGHFGTGFYFFGDEETASSYDNRDVSTVDASNYNLLRIKSLDDGLMLHDILKNINNLRYESYLEGMAYSFVSEYELPYYEYKNLLDFKQFDEWVMSNEQVVSFLSGNITINDVEPYDNNRDLTNKILNHYMSKFNSQKSKLNAEVNYLVLELLSVLKDLGVNVRSISKEDLYNDIINYQPTKDTLSTKILKKLGFEGVYVKGIKGLDNETYGSVIFDIK